MASNSFAKNTLKLVGPPGGRALVCKFSVVTTALTALEEQGCTVARSGVGTYTITLPRTYKLVAYHLTLRRAAGAQTQSVWVTGETTSTLTLTQFTSADGTAVDTLTFTASLVLIVRENS